jgi:hypothetical protein
VQIEGRYFRLVAWEHEPYTGAVDGYVRSIRDIVEIKCRGVKYTKSKRWWKKALIRWGASRVQVTIAWR